MHRTSDEIYIGENAKVIQHNQEFENADKGDNIEHLESPHCTIIAVNVTKNNARIRHSKNCTQRSYEVSASLFIRPI